MYALENYINSPVENEDELVRYYSRTDKLIIFDIGACEGEDSIKYSNLFPNATIYSFEPLDINIERIKKNINNFNKNNIKVVNAALSKEIGREKFYVSSGKPEGVGGEEWDFGNKSSSFLPPDRVSETHPWLKFDNIIDVNTDTIENFCATNNIKEIDFVHLDVQGAEMMVLQGAGQYLKNIKTIWLEVENIPLYKNQPLKNDIEKFLNENNFIRTYEKVDAISGDQFYVNSAYFEVDNKNVLRSNIVRSNLKKILPKTIKRKIRNVFVGNIENKSSLQKDEGATYRKNSYSQSGEDLIIKFIFTNIGIEKPSYIDVGAHHPFFTNNTALFYEQGSRGINIEPNPILFNDFVSYRRKDVNLNIGISEQLGEFDFFIMSALTLSTFSKEEALKLETESSYKISSICKVKTDTIINIINIYNNSVFPDFLTLDAEGLDESILKSINYEVTPPKVICVETIEFSEKGRGSKKHSIINFLKSKGYIIYADTYINTIFVRENIWIR